MQQWTSDPLDPPVRTDHLKRVQLEFQDTRVSGPSFTVFAFLNATDLPPDADRSHPAFAGAFTVFAYGDCWGDGGHCSWQQATPASAFDRRPEHHLQPTTYTLDITDAVKKIYAGDADPATPIRVTVHAAFADDPEGTNVLRFDDLTMYSYE